nr:GNAT family N-acetyltransferase [Vallicoccus soli]
MTTVEPAGAADLDGLAALLVDAVEGGASVGFLSGLDLEGARAFWRRALGGGASTWVARDRDGAVVGCVQLHPSAMPNGAHRAEVAKLLVLRRARGAGVAGALMARLEQEARALGRTVLVLDTETGSPAEAVYARWGWQRVGTVDAYAADPYGTLRPTTILTKRL